VIVPLSTLRRASAWVLLLLGVGVFGAFLYVQAFSRANPGPTGVSRIRSR
jgi:hypothetical protein